MSKDASSKTVSSLQLSLSPLCMCKRGSLGEGKGKKGQHASHAQALQKQFLPLAYGTPFPHVLSTRTKHQQEHFFSLSPLF